MHCPVHFTQKPKHRKRDPYSLSVQHGQQALEAVIPELILGRDDSPRSGPDDWRVPARHANPHKRWPSNASRSVRGTLAPGSAAWNPNPPNTDLAGESRAIHSGHLCLAHMLSRRSS